MKVAEAVGLALAGAGVDDVFGVVGSGNFHVTNALLAGGARYVAARHEGGATTMADACARLTGRVTAVSLHQGRGLTNAMTGLAEAARSRTPLLVLAAEASDRPFAVDQPALAAAVGASSARVTSAGTAVGEALAAFALARDQRRTVLVNLPLAVQALEVPDDVARELLFSPGAGVPAPPPPPQPSAAEVEALADLLGGARRPVLIAGRGACGAGDELAVLAQACGALLATYTAAKGLFAGSAWNLDVSGGFATDLAAELIREADVVTAFGCSLAGWTTRHGRLLGPRVRVAQVDVEAAAIGRSRPIELGIVAEAAATARAVAGLLLGRPGADRGYRGEAVARAVRERGRWRDVPHDDWSTRGPDARIDPRVFTAALDDVLPAERVVCVDSGNFMGYPSMYLSVPDPAGFCLTQASESIGLGLATGIGAALARPDRLAVAALGDGGALMSAVELETVRRLGLAMVVVIYDDNAYGAQVHHFGDGDPLTTVTFPPTDLAAIGRGYGFDAVTVRAVADLGAVRDWVEGARARPLLVDAKVASPQGSWWLEEASRGH